MRGGQAEGKHAQKPGGEEDHGEILEQEDQW